ncbi:hypothetical protein CEXT_227001, partial [Caerostris extrusa]
MGLEEKMPRRQ